MIVSGGEINSGNAEFRSNKRDVGERALSGFKAFAGNIILEIGIGTIIEDGIVFSFTVNLDDKLQGVQFFRK